MKDVKVLFTYALWPYGEEWGRFRKGAGTNSFSYGLALIAAVAEKAGFSVSVCDTRVERMNENEFNEYLNKGKFDVIGFSCYTTSASHASFSLVRSHNAFVRAYQTIQWILALKTPFRNALLSKAMVMNPPTVSPSKKINVLPY